MPALNIPTWIGRPTLQLHVSSSVLLSLLNTYVASDGLYPGELSLSPGASSNINKQIMSYDFGVCLMTRSEKVYH